MESIGLSLNKKKIKKEIVVVLVIILMSVLSIYIVKLWMHNSKVEQEPLKIIQVPVIEYNVKKYR